VVGSEEIVVTGLPRLMLVTDRRATRGRELVAVVRDAVAGGVGLVQVREKDLDEPAVEALVDELLAVLPAGARLLVNGCPGLAARRGLGLHVPASQIDHPPEGVRLFGASVHDESEVRAACACGAHYLVAGTVFVTDSKPGRPPAGPAWIARVRDLAREIPVFAIGGITAVRVAEVMRAGAWGVAVRSAILAAPDVGHAAARLAEAIARGVAAGGRLEA
jgi:thiamine-phosphate pyrophosphorylase